MAMYLLRPRWNRVRKVTRSYSTASRINLIDDKDLREGEMKEVPFPGTRKKVFATDCSTAVLSFSLLNDATDPLVKSGRPGVRNTISLSSRGRCSVQRHSH